MNTLQTTLTFVALTAISPFTLATEFDYGDGAENFANPGYLKNHDGKFDYWRSVGKLSSPRFGSCTAFAIDTKSQKDTNSIYVMTSAHCVNKQHGLIEVDQAIEGSMTFNYFNDTADSYKIFALKKVVWSSIQGIDLAIIELAATQGELKDAKIIPLKLADAAPPENTDILIVNAAGSAPLKAAACTHQASSSLFEAPWVWRHSVRNQCAGILPGSSGSPVIIRATNEVYAVLGTRAMDLTPLAGYDSIAGSNYGSPTSVINSCFVDGKLNTDPDTCELFPAASITVPSDLTSHAKITINAMGETVYPEWSFGVSASARFIRTKRVYDAIDCEKPENYSASFNPELSNVTVPMGPQPGLNNLCIMATNSTEEQLPMGAYRNAVTIPTYLHPAGPTPVPVVGFFFNKTTNRVAIEWPNRKNEGIARYQVKAGRIEDINCEVTQDYKEVTFNWWRRESNFPMKLCTYAYDSNNQRSALTEYILEWEALKDSAP